MKNIKVDFTISTGKQYENVHVSAEADTEKTLSEFLNASLKIGKTAEEKFHNCFIRDEVAEKAEATPVRGGAEKEVTFEKEQNE